MSFKLWMEELSDEQTSLMQRMGFQLIDSISIGGMDMMLLKNGHYPREYRYHLAFQREGMNVFDYGQQKGRDEDKKKPHQKIGMIEGFRVLKPMMERIYQWIKRYGEVVIASSNVELTEKWANNLQMGARMLDMPLVAEKGQFMGWPLYLVGIKDEL